VSVGPVRSRKLSARLWWATLPYYGWTCGSAGQRVDDILDGARPAPWWAYPLGWLNRLAARIPGFGAFEPTPPVVCDCDFCRGVAGAVFEP